MNLDFGINVRKAKEASSSINVKSTTPIAIVGKWSGEVGLKSFNSAAEAKEYIVSNSVNGGTLVDAIDAIANYNVQCNIVINALATDAKTSDIVAAFDSFALSDANLDVNLFNGLFIAPGLSDNLEVAAKMDAIATKFRATAIVDVPADGSDAFIKSFASESVYLVKGKYIVDTKEVAGSAILAGHIAYYDGAIEFGWAKNHSNRVAIGVSGAVDPVEYIDGAECEARTLRQKGVATIVKDEGWRVYGFETRDIDSIWQSLDRVRTFNRLLTAISSSIKWARDRELNKLIWVKKSINDFFSELKGANVVLGWSIVFDERNTEATISDGKVYMKILVEDMPSIRELNIELVYSDSWGDVIINYINEEE